MLLTHTVGLGYDLADADLTKWSNSVGRKATNLDWSKAGFNTPLKFTPAEGWYYGSAMDWAAILLEKITGLTIGEYMKANIFDPLGMKDTTFWPSASVADRTVTCTYRQEDGSLLPGALPVPERHEIESGGAGLFSTADDYSAFFQGLLSGKLVSETTLTAMFWPQLYGEQQSSLNAIVYASAASIMAFVPGFPVNLPIDHGFGGLLNLRDVPGKRRKDSMTWSGMANSRWVRNLSALRRCLQYDFFSDFYLRSGSIARRASQQS
jgi:CubicO group peptidase (beta-lactamase class C family)